MTSVLASSLASSPVDETTTMSVDSMSSTSSLLPSTSDVTSSSGIDVTWSDFRDDMAIAFYIQLALIALSVLLRLLSSPPPRNLKERGFLANYVGTADELPLHTRFYVGLHAVQGVSSVYVTCIWMTRTYGEEISDAAEGFQLLAAIVFLFCAVYEFVRNGFRVSYVLSGPAILDVFTTIPLFHEYSEDDTMWVSMGYLRIVRAMMSFTQIEATGVLDEVPEFSRGLVKSLVKFVTLVICFAGTIFVVEVLGEIDGFEDSFIITGMGDISFYQMVYFTFVTISTVGYGDYSPVTILGRFFIVIFIVWGVVFFSIETSNLLELRDRLLSGRGVYKKSWNRRERRYHVVVCGGGVTNPRVVLSFLREMYHSDHENPPDCVFVSSAPLHEDLSSVFLKGSLSSYLTFLRGSVMEDEDSDRMLLDDAKLVVVLADLDTGNADAEDEQNILRVVALKKLFPDLNYRLMVLNTSSLYLAADCGISNVRCIAVSELKSCLIAQSCMCPGFSTLVWNLAQTVASDGDDGSPGPSGSGRSTKRIRPDSASDWIEEYKYGLGMEVYSMRLSKAYTGVSFQEAARRIYKQGSVVLLGKVEDGRVLLNPTKSRVESSDVVIVVAPGPDRLSVFALDESLRLENQVLNINEKKMWQAELDSLMENMMPEKVADAVKKNPPLWRKRASGRGTVSQSLQARLDLCTSQAGLTLTDMNSLLNPPKALVGEASEGVHEKNLRRGGHLVITSCDTNVWPEVFSVIRSLRSRCLPFWQPVVVLVPEHPPEPLKNVYTGVSFVNGSPKCFAARLVAGISMCNKIIYIAGRKPLPGEKLDSRLVDVDAIVTAAALMSNQFDGNSCEVFTLYDFADDANVDLLPREKNDSAKADMTGRRQSRLLLDEDGPSMVSSLARIAAGHIFTVENTAMIAAASYYRSCVLDVVQALSMPVRTLQPSIPFMLSVPPELEGKSYRDLVLHLLDRDMIALGLYRARGTKGSLLPYVASFAPPQTKVHSSDQVYVLASVESLSELFQEERDLRHQQK